jgi:hypothetical protein
LEKKGNVQPPLFNGEGNNVTNSVDKWIRDNGEIFYNSEILLRRINED